MGSKTDDMADDDVFGGDTCEHCGATALESFDCALNGCKFGLLADEPDKSASGTQNTNGESNG